MYHRRLEIFVANLILLSAAQQQQQQQQKQQQQQQKPLGTLNTTFET
jgi:hypothetical protein